MDTTKQKFIDQSLLEIVEGAQSFFEKSDFFATKEHASYRSLLVSPTFQSCVNLIGEETSRIENNKRSNILKESDALSYSDKSSDIEVTRKLG